VTSLDHAGVRVVDPVGERFRKGAKDPGPRVGGSAHVAVVRGSAPAVGGRDVPAAVAEVEARLTGPGGPFETRSEDVLGEPMTVFANRARSLRELVASSRAFGEAECAVFSDGRTERRLTFAQHERAVASVAAGLRDRFGVGKGDRVAILAATCPEWIVTFWATVSLGAVAAGLNGWWTGPEIDHALHDAEPTVLIADRKRLARLEGRAPAVPVVEIESGFDELWSHDPDARLPEEWIDEDDPALLLYTSGTTGPARGVLTSHRNVIALVGVNFFHGLRVSMLAPPAPDAPPPCQLVTSPLFHVSGLHNGAIALLAGGVKSVWTTGRFDPEVALALIERERVTGWGFTDTLLRRVLDHPGLARHDRSSLRSLGGGGSPFSASLLARAREVFPLAQPSLAVGYGLTECSALATLNFGDELARHPGSVGRPLPTVEVDVRDEGGRPVAPGRRGEIHVRSPMVMLGYWRRPEETATALRPGRWLATGDVGWLSGGRLSIDARARDLILRGGENIAPSEVEQRLEAHPAVAEAAVIGVPHPELGQEVKAVVVPRPGARIDPAALAAWAGEALAAYKVPTHWEIRDTPLPRNAADKVVKSALVAGHPASFVEER